MATTTNEETTAGLRLTLLASIVLLFVVALVSRLWFLQVLAGPRFEELSQSNAVRVVQTVAPRGRILAADGAPLVANRAAPTVVVDRQVLLDQLETGYEPKDDGAVQVLQDLAQLLGLEYEEILEALDTRRYGPFSPVPVLEDVPPEVRFYLQEHREFFPGVDVVDLPVRTYPQGELGAHMLGYLNEIAPAELESPEFVGYRPGEFVGRAGLEQTYEHDLQGQEGTNRLAVSARGTVLEVLSTVPPTPGNDVVTSLDLELQLAVEAALEQGIMASRNIIRRDGRRLESVAGSAVVLDPRDGSVKALASWPTFDPSLTVDGISNEEFLAIYDRTVEDEVPGINRAIQGAYPPGSVFKVVSGAAALDAGLITPDSTVSCPPAWNLGSITFRNWNSSNEGAMDLARALQRSCDTFFYELAFQQYVREENALDDGQDIEEQLLRMSNAFGFGIELGIDLPYERSGVIPSREWKADYWERTRGTSCQLADQFAAQLSQPGADASAQYAFQFFSEQCTDGYRFRGGDAVNASIGQGDVLTTPLQVAAAYAAIANGGTLYAPTIGDRVVGPDGRTVREIDPRPIGQLPITDTQLEEIQRGLVQVMDVGGTGRGAFVSTSNGGQPFPLAEDVALDGRVIPVAGKTGTAELGSQIPYAWFATYAPADDPQYVVVVSIERGGGGSQTAAPIARRILEAAFGLPVTPFAPGPEILD